MAGSVHRVGVVGLGTMGAGIAEVFAGSGLQVVAVEIEPAAVERGREHLQRSTERAVAKGRLRRQDADALVARIAFGTDLGSLSDTDLVVEAVPERLEVKQDLFAQLDRICKPGTILATNTSSLSVTRLAMSTSRPGRVVGMHFFNPAPAMKLVEVVRTVVADAAVIDQVEELTRRAGKEPVTVGDRAGFVANRLLFGYLNQAVGVLDAGLATPEEIDAAMTGAGLPMGPLRLLDLIGLETAAHVLDALYAETHSGRHDAAPLLRELVTVGWLGRKTGRGFYAYASGSGDVQHDDRGSDSRNLGFAHLFAAAGVTVSAFGPPDAPPDRLALAAALIVAYLNDATAMLESGYCDSLGIDTAMTLGCGYPVGPIAQLSQLGPQLVLSAQRALHDRYGAPELYPSAWLRHAADGSLAHTAGSGADAAP